MRAALEKGETDGETVESGWTRGDRIRGGIVLATLLIGVVMGTGVEGLLTVFQDVVNAAEQILGEAINSL